MALHAPAGWLVTPSSTALKFLNEDEALSARFVVTAPLTAKVGEYSRSRRS